MPLRSFGKNSCRFGWNLNPFTPCSSISRRARSTASARDGSTLPNGISTSGLARAASAISSLGICGRPLRASQSTVNRTAAMFRAR